MNTARAWLRRHARHWWAFPFYVLLAACTLGANPFAQKTVGPFDLLVAQGGWTSPVNTSQVRHAERSDVLDFFLPRWIWARQTIRAGHFPYWDPLPAGGDNVFQNPVYGELTPAFAIFTATPDPALGFYLGVLFNLSIAGYGMHLWLRRRLGAAATVLGSITLMLCGFHAAWLFWPQVLTSIWIGWALWALDGWWEKKDPFHYLALVASLSLIILGGFPFVGIMCFAAVGLYAFCLATMERNAPRLAGLCGLGAAMLLSLGLCAVPVATMAGWINNFDLGYRQGGSLLHFPHDVLLLFPHFAKRDPHVEKTIYAGLIPVFLAPLAYIVMLRQWKKLSVIELYALLLGAISATLVFELIPERYLDWVPFLRINSWGRAAILLDLALAIAAAYALDLAVRNLKMRKLTVVLALAAIGLQYADTSSLFRRFNGPTSTLDFYPSTPLISEIKANIRPFQSVIADNHFLVSGTLGAYGLPEWFAHGFKRPPLKTALGQLSNNPFTTPTASILYASDLNLESPLMAAMGVRYVLCDCNPTYDDLPPSFEGDPKQTPSIPLPPLPASSWEQAFELKDPISLHAIKLNMATYGKSGLPGDIVLTLYPNTGSLAIASSKLAAEQVLDNGTAGFAFDHPLNLQPGTYRFTVHYNAPAGGAPITVWSKPLKATNCSLKIDSTPVLGCMNFQLATIRTTASRFKQVSVVDGVHLLENTEVPAGPYFLANLSAFPEHGAAAQVITEVTSGSDFTIRYRGHASGYIVIPMQWTRDWQVASKGQPLARQRYLGFLPAIAVQGPTTLSFHYHSGAWNFTWISALALFAAIGLAFSLHRPRASRSIHQTPLQA